MKKAGNHILYPGWGIPILIVFLLGFHFSVGAQNRLLPPVSLQNDGSLVYPSDSLGNRVPDFSYCGYRSSDVPVPFVPVKIVVPVPGGDATSEIQKAIDYVASLPVDESGFRGALLLQPGLFRVSGRFTIKTPGIVIRGSGWGDKGTVLLADGTDRETLFRIEGEPDEFSDDTVFIGEDYLPAGSPKLKVEHPDGLKPGDRIQIVRPATQAWIDHIGMKEFGGETEWLGWRAGYDNMQWIRSIEAIDGKP